MELRKNVLAVVVPEVTSNDAVVGVVAVEVVGPIP
jgi:hypothetical protein